MQKQNGGFHDFAPSWMKAPDKNGKMDTNNKNGDCLFSKDDLHRQTSFHSVYDDSFKTRLRHRNHSVDDIKDQTPTAIKPITKEDCSLDDEFPSLNGDGKKKSLGKLGVWEKSPAQITVKPVTINLRKQMKSTKDDFVMLKTKNGTPKLRNSTLILKETQSKPKDIDKKKEPPEDTNRNLSSSNEAEFKLLCEMGWIESDENDYVITDEEKREFASKTSVSGGGGGVVRGGSGGGASVGGNSTIVGGLRRFDIDSGDDDDDSLDEDEDIDELTSRYSLNRD